MSAVEHGLQAMARLMPRGVCSRTLTYAASAALFPMLALLYLAVSEEAWRPLIAMAVGVTLLSMIGLVRSLRPVAAVAVMLDRQAQQQTGAGGGRAVDDHRRIIANFQIITERLESLNKQAQRHPVTGLQLRDEFMSAVTKDLAFGSEPALMGLLRLTNYDQVVAFDVEAAEHILLVTAKRLATALGEGRPIAHIDRDCFAVWFGAATSPKDAQAELEAIGYALIRDIDNEGVTITPDVQLGAALYPVDADEPGNLLNRAFVSLARPQRTADGAIAFFARPSPQAARKRFSLEQDLRHAVRRGELSLQYQPIVDLAMGRVLGAEALLRWRTSRDALIPPAQIVPVLEESGLVHEIGLWTFNAACRQLREWREAGHPEFKVAVNLSAHQLRDGALVSALKRTVASHDLRPAQIELELTETAAMDDAARTHAMFEQLREAGFSLAIDDFGSGYSSLAYLRRLPFQKLKIDREFVSHVDQRADSRTICKALIDLTAGLELAVLAEGVERVEEVETLHALGCAAFQGYYFSRPLDAADFINTVVDPEWLARMGSRVRRQQDELRRRLS